MATKRGLEAVIFDWSGTTVDHGCMAPVVPFREVFRQRGIPVTIEEVRGPMGAHKRAHLEQLIALPRVRAHWEKTFGQAPTHGDVDAMFGELVGLQLACLRDYAEPIDGCLDTVRALRARGLRIGSTTGFTGEMMAILLPEARRRGYAPDVTVSGSDVPAGRPAPYMALKNVIDLGVSRVSACVKVDDTTTGIDEGNNAGMWTVGVVMTGNEVGLTKRDLDALDASARETLRRRGTARLKAAGAHYVIDGIGELLGCIDDIERRLAADERP